MTQPSGFRRVARDIADLCELQAELIAVDGKAAARRSGMAAALLMIATVFGLSATTATVFALASLLHEQAQWTVSNSLLVAAAGAAVIGGLLVYAGSRVMKSAMTALDETRSELAENLRWIKEVVTTPEPSQGSSGNEYNSPPNRATAFARNAGPRGKFDDTSYQN